MITAELLTISVENAEWLDVCNLIDRPIDYVDDHALLDYVAMVADNPGEHEADHIFNADFDANELLGATAKEVKAFINTKGLQDYFEEVNETYCSDNGLCVECRTILIESEEGYSECPNGC